MNGLKGKVAIVTGSTGGIGKGIALRLTDEGAKVVFTGRTAATGEALVKEVRAKGGDAAFVQADVLSQPQMQALVDKTVNIYGQVDILVASAGGDAASDGRKRNARGFFQNIDPTDVAETVARATLGKLNPARAVVDHMIMRKEGSILFITSEGGRFPTPGQTAVATYSAGIIMSSKVIAKELSRYKIRVNTIAVTLVQNRPTGEMFTSGVMDEAQTRIYKKIADQAPFGLAKPANIASVAAFLVSDEASFMTGATVSPTGGVTYS